MEDVIALVGMDLCGSALAENLMAGFSMLDAPIAGSSGPAHRREAPVLVGGERAVFERCRTVLEAGSDGG